MQRGFDKRGVSAVVATVLIIMITVAAIGIIWVAIIPMVRENLGVGNVCKDLDVSIVTSQGYTCYVPGNITLVQVNKGSSELQVSGLKFYLTSLGSSLEYQEDVSISPNDYRVFYLNTSEASKIEEISVVPVVQTGNSQTDCSSISLESIPLCSAGSVVIGTEPGQINPSKIINPSRGGGNNDGNGGDSPSSTDDIYPIFSNYLDNNNSLFGSGIGWFNVTIDNSNGTVLLEINNTHITATNLSMSVYNVSYNFDSNGTYPYRWYSWGNGTNKNYNVSDIRSYIVKVCVPECSCADSLSVIESCDNLCGGICSGTKQDGTLSFPFAIKNWTGLNATRNNMTASYILLNSLNSSMEDYLIMASPTANGGKGWQPIGNGVKDFNGTFNGNGFFVNDLYINRPTENFVGLFGTALIAANISRLNLVNFSALGRYYVGGLVGYNEKGNIKNCSSQGIVSGIYEVGGLVGRNYAGLVESSYSNVTLLGLLGGPSSVFFGGLVGSNYAAGSVKRAYINNCYSAGSIIFSGTNNVVGGLTNIWNDVGSYSFVNNSYSIVNVSTVNGNGLIGGAAGIVGYSYWDVNASNKTISLSGLGKTTDEMKMVSTFSYWDQNVWNITEGNYPKLKWQN